MKPSSIRTELILPADLIVLPLIQSYVQELGHLAGLSSEKANLLVLAVEEACTNTFEHGYGSEESGTVSLRGDLTPRALCLFIRDDGLPFDESVAPVFSPPADLDTGRPSLQGLGLELIHRAVDEVRWINHGSKGKELQLIKYLATKDSGAVLQDTDGTAPCAGPDAEQTRPASHNYLIRRMLPEDALRVCQCFFRTFGYSYDEDLYSPERLIRLNQTGEFLSVVAVDEGSGQVIGHVALVRPNLALVGERTHLVVAPEHRGQHLRERMGNFLESELNQLGMVGTYGQAVTTHTISQKASESRGMRVCGIDLGLGQQYNFKAIKSPGGKRSTPPDGSKKHSERESLVFYFKYLIAPLKTVVHAPPRHREMLAQIYENLRVDVELRDAAPATGHGLVSVSYLADEKLGEIRVERVGSDSIPEVRRAWRDLCEIGGAEVILLDLPLAQAGTPDLCAAAEDDGFIFTGIHPYFADDGDFLRLIYLDIDLDLDRLQIFSPFGRELLAYIRKDMELKKKAGSS